MFCTSCGHALKEEDRFCPQCGLTTSKVAVAPQPSGPPKRLVRPMHKKSIAGVCAGFADYLEVDLTLMRIIWLCAAIFTGVGFIAYLVCWIVMPKDYAATDPRPSASGLSGSP
jgi:phage shock protein C